MSDRVHFYHVIIQACDFFQVIVLGIAVVLEGISVVRGSRQLTRIRIPTVAPVPGPGEVVGGLTAFSTVTWMGYTSPGVIRLAVGGSSGVPGKAPPIPSNERKWKLDQTSEVNGVISECWNERRYKTVITKFANGFTLKYMFVWVSNLDFLKQIICGNVLGVRVGSNVCCYTSVELYYLWVALGRCIVILTYIWKVRTEHCTVCRTSIYRIFRCRDEGMKRWCWFNALTHICLIVKLIQIHRCFVFYTVRWRILIDWKAGFI